MKLKRIFMASQKRFFRSRGWGCCFAGVVGTPGSPAAVEEEGMSAEVVVGTWLAVAAEGWQEDSRPLVQGVGSSAAVVVGVVERCSRRCWGVEGRRRYQSHMRCCWWHYCTVEAARTQRHG